LKLKQLTVVSLAAENKVRGEGCDSTFERGEGLARLTAVSLAAENKVPSSLLLSSLELSDTKVYEPQIRALLGTASHF